MKSIAQERSTEPQMQSFLGNVSLFFLAAALFFEVFVLVFSAVLIAVLLTLLAGAFRRRLRLQHWAALTHPQQRRRLRAAGRR